MPIRPLTASPINFCPLSIRFRTTDATAFTTAVDNKNTASESEECPRKATAEKDHCSTEKASHKTIPRPFGLPMLGNVRDFLGSFGPKAHTFLHKRWRQFGPIYKFSSLGESMVFMFKYSDVTALRRAEGDFPEHIDFKHLRRYREEKGLPLGVLISTGPEWARQRRMLASHMLKPEVVARYFDGLNEVARDAVAFTEKQRLDNEQSPDVETLVAKFALEGIGQTILGTRLGCFRQDDPESLSRFLFFARRNFTDAKQLLIAPEWLWRFLPAWRRHNEGWNYILETARQHVDSQLEKWDTTGGTPGNCVLGMLKSDAMMSRGELYVNICDLLLAAIDTTASAILWSLHELSRHPDVQDRIVNELPADQGTEFLTFKQLHGLRYLRAVLKEVLRLHPVAFFTSRITKRETEIQGYTIPPNSHVACSMYVMGRDRAMFCDPDSFRPERWLQENGGNGGFFANVPFGHGARMCLGRRIAETEILLFLLQMCRNFRIEAESSTPVEPAFRILMVPRDKLNLRFIARQ